MFNFYDGSSSPKLERFDSLRSPVKDRNIDTPGFNHNLRQTKRDVKTIPATPIHSNQRLINQKGNNPLYSEYGSPKSSSRLGSILKDRKEKAQEATAANE